jgi:hypothetical protein
VTSGMSSAIVPASSGDRARRHSCRCRPRWSRWALLRRTSTGAAWPALPHTAGPTVSSTALASPAHTRAGGRRPHGS